MTDDRIDQPAQDVDTSEEGAAHGGAGLEEFTDGTPAETTPIAVSPTDGTRADAVAPEQAVTPGPAVAESPTAPDAPPAPGAHPLDEATPETSAGDDDLPVGVVAEASSTPETPTPENPTPATSTTPETPAPGTSESENPAPEATTSEAPAAEAAAPAAAGRPSAASHGPRPVPGRPGAPGRPGTGSPRPRPVATPAPRGGSSPVPAVIEPTVEPVDPHLWGRIDDQGVVYVRTAAGERAIGNWQAGDAEAGLAHFGLRFDDFATEIALLEARLASGSGDPRQTKQQAMALRESVDTLAAIGDLDSAAARLETVIGAADTAIAGASAARAKARADAVAAKEALCAEAETLAGSTQWKTAGDRFKTIVDEWRAIKGIDRKTDDALWKRFARARDTFTRNRGSHFAELDKQRGAAREAKEALIKRADELSSSSEWAETAAAYRELMNEWRSAGRAPREVEDELWERFRAAQEKFFARRNQTFAARDAEFEANAAAKEKLLAEAKTIDPDGDLEAAKSALRSIQERWEAIGKVPRERMRELDGRLRAIEDRVRTATDAQWRRTDPATAARVEQFRARAQSFRDQAARARAAGDERRAAEAEEQAATWEQWLETARSSAQR